MAEKNGFWDLGSPREKKYRKPDFSGHTIDTSEVTEDRTADDAYTAKAEPIPEKGTVKENTEERSISSSFWMDPIGGKRVVTSSYRRHPSVNRGADPKAAPKRREPGKTVAAYAPDGVLIKRIEVRTWESETEFYGRFVSDARHSHNSRSDIGIDEHPAPVEFFSYVPQYSHMNLRQLEYYRWVRENIRNGRHPGCDISYLLLYVYEILNLPDEIKPEEGLRLLSSLWTGYRDRFPRLDAYLCEWLADYCMIYGLKLPEELYGILPSVTPKAQFKEFYIDPVMDGDDSILGAIVAEAASDYDYRSSRYYEGNEELFDRHIPEAVGRTVRNSLNGGGIFSLDRTYTMTRDSYCGAIVSSALKRRIDVEFCSFTRRADVRQAATALVKYCENNVRTIAGVKARLNADGVDSAMKAVADRYFHALLPEKARPAEDRFMPADYMRNYEADESGFDIDRAAEIEYRSWSNTERLTGDTLTETVYPESPETVEGEIGSDAEYLCDVPGDGKRDTEEKTGDGGLAPAIGAALGGSFREYCRLNGVFEGDLADRINTLMLNHMGDVALEDRGNGYEIVEDYREDIEQWLQENT